MTSRYQDIYPSEPLACSDDILRPLASALLHLEYFEAEPDSMPTRRFSQHHILINLNDIPHRVENWRDSEHRDFIYRQNEIIVTPAGVESGWRWHAKSRVIVITLEPQQLEAFAQSQLGLLLTDVQLRNIPQFVDEDITQAGIMLLDALNSKLGSEVMFESLARVFLAKLIQKYGLERDEDIQFNRSFTSRQYKRVLDYIGDRYSQTIALEELAAEAGLSPYHFSRLFKAAIGQPPYRFVMAYRVEQAKKMLVDRDCALADIAFACGFCDQAHFSRTFKQLAGVSPRIWRQGA